MELPVSVFPGLEGIIENISLRCKEAEEERAELGMRVPKNYNVEAHLFSSRNANGEAVRESSTIRLFVGNIIQNDVSSDEAKDLGCIEEYILRMKSLFPEFGEKDVVYVMRHAKEYVEPRLKMNFATEEMLQEYKHEEAKKGFDVDEAVAYLVAHASDARDAMEKLLPLVVERFPIIQNTTLRHELDHIDLFQSQLGKEHYKKGDAFEEVKKGVEKKEISPGEFVNANNELLDSYCRFNTFLEGRAHFFSYILPGKWSAVDYRVVERSILKSIDNHYVNGFFLPDILNRLLAPFKLAGRINDDTIAYCQHVVRKGKKEALQYRYDIENVQKGFAHYLLGKKLEFWKNKCSIIAASVIPVIGRTFEQDPSRFVYAQGATSYEDFLDICNGTVSVL